MAVLSVTCELVSTSNSLFRANLQGMGPLFNPPFMAARGFCVEPQHSRSCGTANLGAREQGISNARNSEEALGFSEASARAEPNSKLTADKAEALPSHLTFSKLGPRLARLSGRGCESFPAPGRAITFPVAARA